MEELHPWMWWCRRDFSLADAVSFLAMQPEAWRSGSAFEFVVRENGRFVAACGLNRIERLHRAANLGYWVRTSATGRGIAKACVSHLAAWAFEKADLDRLEILVAAGNLASQRVAEKAGAMREGVLRSRLLVHGRRHDAVVYSILRDRASREE